jgi:hypothetical protein
MKPFFGFGTSAQIAAFKDAGHNIVEAGVTAADHALAILKADPGASKVIDAIHIMQQSDLKWYEKLEHVAVNDALPLIVEAVTNGAKLVASERDTAFALTTSLYNDLAAGLVKASGTVQSASQ